MTLKLSIPSKTYLSGEYATLKNGAALIAATTPYFHLIVQEGNGLASGFHAESPAGYFVREHSSFFSKFDLSFEDPHQGRGGFGASGAQFLSVVALYNYAESRALSVESLWQEFRRILDLKKDSSSGADLLCQCVGQIAQVTFDPAAARPLRWPFENHGFAIYRTGFKINTHSHLVDLQDLPFDVIKGAAQEVIDGFEIKDYDQFLTALKKFGQHLNSNNLVAATTKDLISFLQKNSAVEFVKGSGGMGADTVVIYYSNLNKQKIFEAMKSYELVATEKDLALGLELKVYPFGENK